MPEYGHVALGSAYGQAVYSNIGDSSGGWITLAIVLAVIAGLTFFAFRKPGGSGGKRGFGPLGTFSEGGDDGLGRDHQGAP